MNFNYSVFGLTVQSTIPLDNLQKVGKITHPQVMVRQGKVEYPKEQSVNTINFEDLVYNPSFCYRKLADNKGGFQVKKNLNSFEVTLDFEENNDRQALFSSFYSTGLSAILQMQGRFMMHASGVLVANKGVGLFCGPSGIGKSTIAAYLKTKGHHLFTDDKCVVYQDEITQRWVAHSGLQIMRLCEDATTNVSTDSFLENPKLNNSFKKKYQFQIKPSEYINTSVPIKAIYILSLVTTDKPEYTLLEGVEKMRHLQRQILRRFMVKGFQQESALWRFFSCLATDVPVYLVSRPANINIRTMGDFMENLLKKH